MYCPDTTMQYSLLKTSVFLIILTSKWNKYFTRAADIFYMKCEPMGSDK